MKAAIIENSVVINLAVVADAEFAGRMGWVISDTARIGDYYDADTGSFSTPQPEAEPITQDDLKQQLTALHNASCAGTTSYQGVNIAIDTEARTNAMGTIDAIESGDMTLPTLWFAGNESITINTMGDMTALKKAIFGALQRRFAAKAKVLSDIDGLSDDEVADYGVAANYNAVAEPDAA